MLKKNHNPRHQKPMSKMRVVLSAVEIGCTKRQEIAEETGLRMGQVSSALWNQSYIGAVIVVKDAQGRYSYQTPGKQTVSKCLCGVNSIFNAFTTIDN